MILGFTSQVWAESVTYTVKDAKTLTVSGTAPTGSSASFTGGSLQSNTMQMTAGNGTILTLTGYNGYKITGITLSVRSNSSNGAGSFTAQVGTTTIAQIADSKFNTSNWNGAWSTSLVSKTVPISNNAYVVKDGEDVVLTTTASVNSLYIGSWTIDYEVGSSDSGNTGSNGDSGESGDSGNTDANTITINASSLTEPNTTASITYGSYNWSSNGISGIYNGASVKEATRLQFNYDSSKTDSYRDRQAVYNTTAISGRISSIKMTTESGTERNWEIYVSNQELNSTNFKNAISLGLKKVSTSGTTFEIPQGENYQFFYANYTTGSASYISKIEITYEAIPNPKTLVSIAISGTPTKTAYFAGEVFDPAGLVVTGTYSDESKKEITDGIIWDADNLTEGTTEIDVLASVNDIVSGIYHITGLNVSAPRTLTSITLSGTPTKTNYEEEESFSTEGLIVTALYSNNETEDVTSQVIWDFEPKVFSTSGETSITVSATYQGKEDIQEYNVTVAASPYLKAKIESFTAAEGNINDDIRYTAFPGNGTSYPYYSVDGGPLKLYQNNTDGVAGNGIRIYAPEEGIIINEVRIVTTSTYDTSIGHSIGDEEEPTAGTEVLKNGTFTLSELNCSDISFYCMGNDKDHRLEIASILVKYTKQEVVLNNITLSGNYKTEFFEGDEFSHEGISVTGSFTTGDKDVTERAIFSTPDMTTAGTKEVYVSYTQNGVTKTVSYQITVIADDIESIALSGDYQTKFKLGDPFSSENLVVSAHYMSGKEKLIEEGWNIFTPEMTSAGSHTITVSYNGLQAEYTIMVLDQSTVFYESFDTNNGTGGNDGSWNGSTASADIHSDNEGWEFTKGNGADKCAKFGTGSARGIAKTPTIFINDAATLTFKAAAWDSNGESTMLNLSATSGELSQNSVELKKGEWTTYTIDIKGINGETQISFSSNEKDNNRFFLDEIQVISENNGILSGLEIAGTPNLNYQVGDPFDFESLNVKATFSDNNTLDVTDKVIWSSSPERLTANITSVTVSAKYGNMTADMTFDVVVDKKQANIQIPDMQLCLTDESILISPIVDPDNAELTYTIVNGNDIITLSGNAVSAIKTGTAIVKAAFAGNDEYKETEATFNVIVNELYRATKKVFSQIAGDICEDIAYEAFKNSTTKPSIPTGTDYLRIYQLGGHIKLTGIPGVLIQSVVITTGSTYASTDINYLVGENTEYALSENVTLNSNGSCTLSNINNRTVDIYCLGADKDHRLDIAAIEVLYTKQEVYLTDIELSGEYKTEFIQRETFNHQGAVITAFYSDGTTLDVTEDAVFSDPDLFTTGDKNISISYTFGKETKSVSYTIHVTEETIESLALSGNYQTTYRTTDSFSAEGLIVTAVYNSGREENITESIEFSIPDMTVGTKNLIVAYEGVTTSYEIKVISTSTLFFESFDKNTKTGGNDGVWNNSAGSSGTWTPDNEWSNLSKASGADRCAKFGTSSAAGSAQTPTITLSGNAVLTFKAAAWDANSEKTILNISATNGTLSKTSVEMVKGVWTEYMIFITGVEESTQITFEASQASNNRFFLDEVMVVRTEAKTLTSSERLEGWKTFYDANKTYMVDENTTVFAAIHSSADAITVRPTGNNIIPAGTPVLLQTKDTETWKINMMEMESTDVVIDGNILQVANGGESNVYILACTSTKPVAFYHYTGTLDQGDVYLSIPSGAASLRIIFEGETEEETAIDQIIGKSTNENIYTITGVKVNSTKGLVIKNGKVILVK